MYRKELHEGGSVVGDFDVKGDSVEMLKGTVDLCFAIVKKFTHFKKEGGKLHLYLGDYTAKKEGAVELPFILTRANGYEFIYAWMHSVDDKDKMTECEGGDGSHGFGFTAKTVDWSTVVFEAINIYYSK